MQPMTFRKQVALSITFAFAIMALTPSVHGELPVNSSPEQSIDVNAASAFSLSSLFSIDKKTLETLKQVAGATLFFTALVCYIRLVTKKTAPKRVYPKDNSFKEIGWYTFDELLVGQMKKDERASSVTINPDNPQELKIEYSKIDSRGLTGMIYSAMKPVIMPALTFVVLFHANFKDIVKGVKGMMDFLGDPENVIRASIDEALKPPAAKSETK